MSGGGRIIVVDYVVDGDRVVEQEMEMNMTYIKTRIEALKQGEI